MWMVAAYMQIQSPSWLAWSEGQQLSGTDYVFIN